MFTRLKISLIGFLVLFPAIAYADPGHGHEAVTSWGIYHYLASPKHFVSIVAAFGLAGVVCYFVYQAYRSK